jgi:hypothetical protein
MVRKRRRAVKLPDRISKTPGNGGLSSGAKENKQQRIREFRELSLPENYPPAMAKTIERTSFSSIGVSRLPKDRMS